MTHMRLWAAASILALIILVGFVLSVPRARDGVRPPETSATQTVTVTLVALRDTYKKGVHTITGYVLAPDACSEVAATATAVEGDITIAVTLAPADGVCLEAPTRLNFSTTVTAPAGATLKATINGAVASTTDL